MYKILKKYEETDSLKDRPRSGRPRVTDNQTDCDIVVAFRNRPFKTAQSAATDLGISRRTVSRRLASAGLKAYRPAIKPKLTEQHKLNRLHWAHEHVRWTHTQWENVLFCDEASFDVNISDHKRRCYRMKNERFKPEMILEKTNRGYGSVNVWGGIFGNEKTPLVRLNGRVTGDVYVRDILAQQV